jgi:class 3 adenylate cyclase
VTVASSRTNGFLFADLRDYTRYVESHGDQAAAVLLHAYRALVRSAVADSGGAEIKTEGDSFYVVFPSASSAVQCGLAILAAVAVSAERAGPPIRVGIGVHAGETVETAEGYVGSAINVAARVCSQAKAGELLVTDTVRALTRTHLPVRFVERRVRRLKGITESVVIYRVEPAGETAAATKTETPVLRRRGPLAVILVGLLIGSAAAGYALVAAQRPAATPLVTPSASPAPASFPNSVEVDLLDQVPSGVRDRCKRDDGTALAGATANLRCDLELSAEANTVWYHRFDTNQALAFYLAGVQQAQNLQFGTCGPNVSPAQGNWQVGGTHSGSANCYQAGGSSWIIWSYNAERILARAVRGGDSAEDWQSLYEWWTQIRLFLET